MKRTATFAAALALILATACQSDKITTESGGSSQDSDDTSVDTTPSGGDDGTAAGLATLDYLKSFDIALDTEALSESETIPDDGDDPFWEDYIENNTFADEVAITFNGSSATADADIDGVSVSISGADVTVTSTAKGVRYSVSGTTGSGSLKIYSDNKFALVLCGVDITNPTGAAINIQSKKRCYVVLQEDTSNTLTDGDTYSDAPDDEDMKATLFSEGKLLFSGSGSLNVEANCKAGIRSDDYIFLRPGVNIGVKATAANGIKANDGIYVRGGVVNVECSAAAAKCLSSDAAVQIEGGRITALTTGGGAMDDDGADVSGSAGVKADGAFYMTGGSLLCKSTGAGGKGISGDGAITIAGGIVRVITTGSQYKSGQYSTSPKGIKADGNLSICGGNILVRCSGGEGAEGIESKGTMDISGGVVQAWAYDDAINSGEALTISGGNIFAMGTSNDGIDSNSTISISGGVVIACGTTIPEGGFDCDENSFAITGGTILGIGGTTSTPTSNVCKQPVIVAGGSSISSGQYITLADSDGEPLLAFCSPADYSRQGFTLLLSCPALEQGGSYVASCGATVSGDSDFCGLFTDATFSGGSSFASVTLSGMVTVTNTDSQGGQGGQGGGPGWH